MSVLIFKLRLDPEPHEDDLLRMHTARAIVSSITGLPPEQISSGLRTGENRVATFSVQGKYIPREWMRAVEVLMKRGMFNGYEWHGEIEDPVHDGKLDAGGDMMVAQCDVWTVYGMRAGVRIQDNTGPGNVGMLPTQALSLLAWLQQERENLERLAKEEQG